MGWGGVSTCGGNVKECEEDTYQDAAAAAAAAAACRVCRCQHPGAIKTEEEEVEEEE